MTNREAFNLCLQDGMETSLRAVTDLSDEAFTRWSLANSEARAGVKIARKLNWFWFTYGGKEYGTGAENIIRWLGAEFQGDIEAERQKWREDSHDWSDEMTRRYGAANEE